MNQLEYIPGIGGQSSVQMDGPTSFVGIAENLRSREWSYNLGYRDIVSATRPAREIDTTFHADYETADTLRRVADADVMAATPGVFVAQNEWRQRGYILASNPNDIHFGRLSTELKIALLDGAWWRLVSKSFMAEDTEPTYTTGTGKSVITTNAANVPLHALTVDGESVQNGTPTPSNPVEINVVRSCNLAITSKYASANSTAIDNYTDLTSVAISGLTFTKNSDGSITVTGTNTNRVDIFLPLEREIKAGEIVTLTGCPSGGSASSYRLDLYKTSSAVEASDYGSGITKTTSGDSNRLRLSVYAGTNWYLTFKPQLEVSSPATPYVPYGSIGLKVNDIITLINLQGNVIASLPDGTKDVLTVDSVGHVVLEKRVSHIASYNGESVGSVYLSTTGELTTGAEVYYKASSTSTVDLGTIDMPNVFDGAVVSITAEVTPTITAEWKTSPDEYLDYPHDYPYDYQKTSYAESITPSVLTPSNVHFVIFGPAVNPYVIVGDNTYQVNVTVPAGGYLTVDGRDKTIVLTLADGTTQNVFSAGVRGSGQGGGNYVFEPVAPGDQSVSWDGSFGFDFGWYEEEGEPPWNQS